MIRKSSCFTDCSGLLDDVRKVSSSSCEDDDDDEKCVEIEVIHIRIVRFILYVKLFVWCVILIMEKKKMRKIRIFFLFTYFSASLFSFSFE